MLETENAGKDNTDEVGDLHKLHTGKDQLEQLTVDESRETAYYQPTEHGVDNGIELEDQGPVCVHMHFKAKLFQCIRGWGRRRTAIVIGHC